MPKFPSSIVLILLTTGVEIYLTFKSKQYVEWKCKVKRRCQKGEGGKRKKKQTLGKYQPWLTPLLVKMSHYLLGWQIQNFLAIFPKNTHKDCGQKGNCLCFLQTIVCWSAIGNVKSLRSVGSASVTNVIMWSSKINKSVMRKNKRFLFPHPVCCSAYSWWLHIWTWNDAPKFCCYCLPHRLPCYTHRSVQSDPGCRGFENILFASRNWISDETEK